MLNNNIKDIPNFIRILLSSMKKSHLKHTHELLSTKLSDSPPDLLFSIYYNQITVPLISYFLCITIKL